VRGAQSRAVEGFTSAMRSLLGSGHSLGDSVRLLGGSGLSPSLREASRSVYEGLRRGRSFSRALAEARDRRGKRLFPGEYVAWFAGIEKTGNLSDAFAGIEDRLAERRKTRERLAQALSYPAFVIILSLSLTAAVFIKAIPWLAERNLTSVSPSSLAWSLGFGLLVLSVLSLAFAAAAVRVLGGGPGEAWVFLRFAQFARSGIPLSEAIPFCAASVGNPRLERALGSVLRDLASGKRLAAAFRDTGFFPELVTDMLLVGAETGDPAAVFERAGAYYAERDQARRSRFLGACEPAALAVTGLYLAIVLESVVLPLLTGIGGSL